MSGHQPGLRAYPVRSEPPRSCFLHTIAGDEAFPVLMRGETVAIDPLPREPEHGELYLVDQRICQATVDEIGAWRLIPYHRPKDPAQVRLWVIAGLDLPTSIGPLHGHEVVSLVRGKVSCIVAVIRERRKAHVR